MVARARRTAPPVLERKTDHVISKIRCDRCGVFHSQEDIDAPLTLAKVYDDNGLTGVYRVLHVPEFQICGGCFENALERMGFGDVASIEPVDEPELAPERCPVCQRPAYFSYASAFEARGQGSVCWAKATCREPDAP